MAFSKNSSKFLRRNAAINVTPLIDVLLVLLIIFMVIVPTTPRGLAGALPQPPTDRAAVPPDPPMVVELTGAAESGTVHFRAGSVQGELLQLEAGLRPLLAQRTDHTIFLRGSRQLEVSSVAQALAAMHSAGATQIGILSDGVMTKE